MSPMDVDKTRCGIGELRKLLTQESHRVVAQTQEMTDQREMTGRPSTALFGGQTVQKKGVKRLEERIAIVTASCDRMPMRVGSVLLASGKVVSPKHRILDAAFVDFDKSSL